MPISNTYSVFNLLLHSIYYYWSISKRNNKNMRAVRCKAKSLHTYVHLHDPDKLKNIQ